MLPPGHQDPGTPYETQIIWSEQRHARDSKRATSQDLQKQQKNTKLTSMSVLTWGRLSHVGYFKKRSNIASVLTISSFRHTYLSTTLYTRLSSRNICIPLMRNPNSADVESPHFFAALSNFARWWGERCCIFSSVVFCSAYWTEPNLISTTLEYWWFWVTSCRTINCMLPSSSFATFLCRRSRKISHRCCTGSGVSWDTVPSAYTRVVCCCWESKYADMSSSSLLTFILQHP